MPVADPIPNILTLGSINLLVGASGIGKTALIASMAKAFTDGGTLFGHTVQPCPVGYIAADRPAKSALQWFSHYKLDLPLYSLIDDHAYQLTKFTRGDQHVTILGEFIDRLELPEGSLIFVDPVGLFVGGNTIDYVRVAMGFVRLSRMALARNICLIGVDHTAKQVADKKERYLRPQDRITGSMAKSGFSSTQMYLMAPEEAGTEYYQFSWVSHHAAPQTFKLAKDEMTGLFLPWEMRKKALSEEPVSPECLALLACIPEYPHFTSTGELIRMMADAPAGASRMTVYRRLKVLERAGLVYQLRHGIWQKPKSQ